MPSLLHLPTELLIEIVAHLPQFYSYVDAVARGVQCEEYDRVNALRSLSQSSRELRNIFLPSLWASAHAIFTARDTGKLDPTPATILERRMVGIQKTAYLHPHIRSLSISLQECGLNNWQPAVEFTKALCVLPNLRSLTIIGVTFETVKNPLASALSGKIFPSVRILHLPRVLSDLLPHFPNIHTLSLAVPQASRGAPAFLSAAAAHCGGVTTIQHMNLNYESVQALREFLPNVTRLLVLKLTLDALPLLAHMPRLSDLRIRLRSDDHGFNDPYKPRPSDVVVAAKRVMQSSRVGGSKTLTIEHTSGLGNIVEREEVFVFGEN